MQMPSSPNDMLTVMSMIKNGGNPQQLVFNLLEQRAQQNPIISNVFTLAKDGKTEEIEGIVRNLAKEKGVDFDKEFNNFRQNFGL